MAGRCKAGPGIWLAAVLAIGTASPCLAMDYQPFDWVPAPAGTNVAMLYYEYATHHEFNNTITGTVNNDTSLDSHIGIARYLHYSEALGHRDVLDFILPFGTLTNGKIAGRSPGRSVRGRRSDRLAGNLVHQSARAETLPVGRYLPDPANWHL
jgi:hypothetical protein